jgi:hypothetical protein
MPHGPLPGSLSLSFFSCLVLLFCAGLHAQQNCNVEVKILLSGTETQAAVRALLSLSHLALQKLTVARLVRDVKGL